MTHASHFRQEAPMTKTMKPAQPPAVHLELPSPSDTIKAHPMFGNLNPFDILQHLLKQSTDLSLNVLNHEKCFILP